jgi:tetratricopeptide (TPR) repeat protein
MRQTLTLVLMLSAVMTARAEWLQASSEHFVVYANDSESSIRGFSEKLERYQAALALITANKIPTPSPSNRVTVYVVSGTRAVQQLYGDNAANIGGFYIPRAGGSIAIVPRVNGTGRELDISMNTLLHEYAHHFQHAASPFALPRWVSEGSAEFYSAASFEKNGAVSLGRPANHRAHELFFGRDVTAENLVDPAAYDRWKKGSNDAFYGKSWLLFHYLTFEETRRGQLGKYLQNLFNGQPSREAATDAFGDLKSLEAALDTYLRKPRMTMLTLPAAKIQVGTISVRRLSQGEAAVMSIQIRSKRGVDEKQAAKLLVEAREVAKRFPTDASVLTALAECEFDAGNDNEAIVAADAAIAADPKQVNAYIQKGYALFRIASKANDTAAFATARAPFVALNKLENDHPLPLVYYYESFLRQQREPTKVAVQGLERAVELAPFDLNVRFTLAVQQLKDNQRNLARKTLVPVANSAHGGPLALFAQNVVMRLDTEPNWDGREGFDAMRTDFENSIKKDN